MNKPLLQIKELTKIFQINSKKLFEKPKQLVALNKVSLDVFPGETLGVIGESGCGKTTLGKCIVRLHKPTSGSILYGDHNIATMDLKDMKPLRRDIQMIFQDPYSSLDPKMTASQIIEEALIVHDVERDPQRRSDLVVQVMREVGLDIYHTKRYPHEFSGGQRQRISTGRALVLSPKLVVCDEPVSALDVSIQAQMINLLKGLQEKYGLTYIFISHDLGVVRYVSDRIAIMYLGRIMELCGADELYKNPLHPYTEALLSALPPGNPFITPERIKLSGEIPSPIGMRKGCPMCGRCRRAIPRCHEECPELEEVSPGHSAACFLLQG